MEHRLEAADVFRQYEQEFLAAWGHTLSRQQRRAFRDICACRTAALGAHIQRCDNCAHEVLLYNSCRSRNCPKCQSIARDKWLTGEARNLLPVRVLGARFRKRFLKLLSTCYRKNKLRLVGQLVDLKRPGAFDRLHSG